MRILVPLLLLAAAAGCVDAYEPIVSAADTASPPSEPAPQEDGPPASPEPSPRPPASPTPAPTPASSTPPNASAPGPAPAPAPLAPRERVAYANGTARANATACAPSAEGAPATCTSDVPELDGAAGNRAATLEVAEGGAANATLSASWAPSQQGLDATARLELLRPDGTLAASGEIAPNGTIDVPREALLASGAYRVVVRPAAPGALAQIDVHVSLALRYAS